MINQEYAKMLAKKFRLMSVFVFITILSPAIVMGLVLCLN